MVHFRLAGEAGEAGEEEEMGTGAGSWVSAMVIAVSRCSRIDFWMLNLEQVYDKLPSGQYVLHLHAIEIEITRVLTHLYT